MKTQRKIITVLVVLFTTPLFASKPNANAINPSDEKRHEMAVDFLKNYDKNFSVVKWKVRVKKNKVIMSRYGSLERLTLFNHYFLEQNEKNQLEIVPLK